MMQNTCTADSYHLFCCVQLPQIYIRILHMH